MLSGYGSDYDTGSEIDDPDYDPNNNVLIGCGSGVKRGRNSKRARGGSNVGGRRGRGRPKGAAVNVNVSCVNIDEAGTSDGVLNNIVELDQHAGHVVVSGIKRGRGRRKCAPQINVRVENVIRPGVPDQVEVHTGGDNGHAIVNIGGSDGQVVGNIDDQVNAGSVVESVAAAHLAGRKPRRAPRTNVTKRGRKRLVSPENWKVNISKKRRSEGKTYMNLDSNKEMPALKVGNPCNDGCFEKIGRGTVDEIFRDYLGLVDNDAKEMYLLSHVCEVNVKRRRKEKGKETIRPVKYAYHVKVNQIKIPVCRIAFNSIHGLGKNRVTRLMKKLSNTGLLISHKRGRGPSPRAFTGPKIDLIHEYIQGLPATNSHHSRASTPHRCYLEGPRSMPQLYGYYIDWLNLNQNQEHTVKLKYFKKVFTRDYNIVFARPKTDVCSTCEKFSMEIKNKKDAGLDHDNIIEQRRIHKESAQVPRRILQNAEATALPMDNTNTKMIAIDLQQTFPCPRLRAGAAFYKRKLWVYNLCIYVINDQEATMLVWDEVTGGRGSIEVASCLLKWLHIKMVQQRQTFTTLRIFCDNCGGQNKNIHVVLTALQLVHDRRLERVEFVFMTAGHSYLPCDRMFGKIEMNVRTSGNIESTDTYKEVIRTSIQQTFPVVTMELVDFLDVKSLSKMITLRPAGFAKACQLIVDIKYPNSYIIKMHYNFSDLEPFKIVGLLKANEERLDLSQVILKPKYKTERLLTLLKCRDLRSLIPFLETESQSWLNSLLQRQVEIRVLPREARLESEDSGSDEEDDIQDYVVPVRVN